MKKTIRKLRHRLTHEGRLTWLTLLAGLPAAVVALSLLWFGDHTPKVQWTLTLFIVGVGLGFVLTAVMGAVFLHENVSPLRIAGTLLVIFGCVLIARSA